MNIYLRKNLNFSWSNVFFDVQKCDNLIGWTLEMLHTHHWSWNQFIPPSPWCLHLQHWCQRHIVKLCEPGLRQLTSQSHMSHSCSSACSRSADPVLPSVPQGVVSASLQDAAYTKWTHQHPPSYGGGEEIPTSFLAQTDRHIHTQRTVYAIKIFWTQ